MNKNFKVLFGNQGQLGDILIGLPAAKYLHDNIPNIDITLCVNKKYSKIIPFLGGLDHVNNIYISDGYENFPSTIDKDYIGFRRFDKIYNPMETHSRYDWYNYYHYTEELAISHKIILPNELNKFNRKIDLNKFFNTYIESKTVGFSPYANGADRSLNKSDAQFIVDLLDKLGYRVLFVGLGNDLNNVSEWANDSFFNAGINLCNLHRFITVDTAWCWLASGYNINTFGLYYKNYPDMIKQWSHFPENPNAKYIVNNDIKHLDREMVEQNLIEWLKNT